MQIESVPIDSLVFDPANARKHNNKNLEAIKGSLTRFGQQKAIVVDAKGVVIAGNGTLAAAKAMGWSTIKIVRTELEGIEKTAFGLADNQTSSLAEWDDEALQKQLMEIGDIEFLGFDLKDFEPKEIQGSKELSESEFSIFEHKCPKCGFEFDS